MPKKQTFPKRPADRRPPLAGSNLVWSLIAVGVAGLFALSLVNATPEVELSYSDLENLIRAAGRRDGGGKEPRFIEVAQPGDDSRHPSRYADIDDVVIGAFQVSGSVRQLAADGSKPSAREAASGQRRRFHTAKLPSENSEGQLSKLLAENRVPFGYEAAPSPWRNWLPMLLLTGLFGMLFFLMLRRIGGAGSPMAFGRSRGKMYAQEDLGITFDDVAGIDEAVEELREVVEFLRSPEKYQVLGGHIPKGVLLVGPPGTGKTMLARRLLSLLPPLEHREALELTQLHSVAGLLPEGAGLIRRRPFRSPHHSCSAAALIGGGTLPRPGELSLAHNGVLFLDELAEFRRAVLDQLRQPLEEGEVWISRTRQRCRFPCRITLVGATNPCPCGWWGDPERPCRCGEAERRRYWGRLSGPLLDRIDLQVVMSRCDPHDLAGAYRQDSRPTQMQGQAPGAPEGSRSVAERVLVARQRSAARNPGGCGNAELPAASLAQTLQLDAAALALWEQAIRQRHLSARSGARLLRVARTISDLEQQERGGPAAVAEALTYRSFDGLGMGAEAELSGSGAAAGRGRAVQPTSGGR